MSDNIKIPVHFSVTVEVVLFRPANQRWKAQFLFYPHGYFRGHGRTPAMALSVAWRRFESAFNPGLRWWAVLARGEGFRSKLRQKKNEKILPAVSLARRLRRAALPNVD